MVLEHAHRARRTPSFGRGEQSHFAISPWTPLALAQDAWQEATDCLEGRALRGNVRVHRQAQAALHRAPSTLHASGGTDGSVERPWRPAAHRRPGRGPDAPFQPRKPRETSTHGPPPACSGSRGCHTCAPGTRRSHGPGGPVRRQRVRVDSGVSVRHRGCAFAAGWYVRPWMGVYPGCH